MLIEIFIIQYIYFPKKKSRVFMSRIVLNVDASEFEENLEELSNLLQKKIMKKIVIRKNTLQVEQVSNSKVRDVLKQTLHKVEPNKYRVISKADSLIVKKIKSRSHKSKKSGGTPPSAPQSMPYFFPRS
jgi:hypothetical protein